MRIRKSSGRDMRWAFLLTEHNVAIATPWLTVDLLIRETGIEKYATTGVRLGLGPMRYQPNVYRFSAHRWRWAFETYNSMERWCPRQPWEATP